MKRFILFLLLLALLAGCEPDYEGGESSPSVSDVTETDDEKERESSSPVPDIVGTDDEDKEDALPPKTAADWLANPVRGAVIEIGYGGPDEYNDPPYPSVASLEQLRALGVQVVALEFQYAWTIEPPYQADETQFALVTAALDNIAEAGLTAVVAVRNGPGRNAMMPGIADEDVITTLYEDEAAQAAYQEMLRDVVGRFRDRAEIIAWEPIIEPALDWYLTGEEESPFPQAAALWNRLAPQLIAAIRDQDSERPILIEPVNWGGLDGFILLDRFDDDNLIYSLHTYEPFAFTHQETPPYNAYPGQFDGEQFNKETLAELLEPVVAFQEQYDVPIVVGEWGGIRWLPGIEQYIADQLSLFETHGWSWFWYAWDDEEWDELGFELHMGPSRESPRYDPTTPAFIPLIAAWQGASPTESTPLPFAYETRADGAVRLTEPSADVSDQNAAFAPDGTRLVFTRFENGYNIGPAGVFILDLADGRITRLTPWEDQDNVNLPGSAWNAVNDRIVFASDRGESDDLWRIAPDGTDFNRVTTHDGPPWYIEPSWSPDGQWVVFEADNNVPDDRQQGSIWKVSADGSDLTPLTDGPANGTDDRQPNWSSAGDRILFQRHIPGSEDWNLFTMTPDGTDIRQVTTAPASDTDASWSPDGRFIVYSTDHGNLPVPNIFIISADGGTPTRITFSDVYEDGAPSWSPDGRFIAFESHEGQDEDTPSMLWRIAVPDLAGETAVSPKLSDVDRWLYLIDVDVEPETIAQIAASTYDMVVLDFIPSEENNTDYPMADVISQLHHAPHPKLAVAYIDIGQAENFRTYWQSGWDIGDPEWIVTGDPDGWEGNFPVAYWYEEFQDIWLGEGGYLQSILDAGFDGVYLDWVEAYSDDDVAAFAVEDGADARQEMIWWVGDIGEYGRSQHPDFIVISQNAAELAQSDEFVEAIDAIAQEQVWFDGSADNDPPGDCPLPRTDDAIDTNAYYDSLSPACRRQYDEFPESALHVSSEEYVHDLQLAQSKGLIIFTVDYALEPDNIAWIYDTSRGLGFVPFAGNRALDRFVEPVP